MRVSIVTISYNQAEYLEAAITSVLKQDYRDVEYVVVDPGSTDRSRDIIEKYRKEIATIIYEPDSGAAEGLNRGFAVATGDILGFLNSDDMLIPGCISRIVDYFRRHNNIDVVSGNALAIDERGNEIRKTYSDSFSLLRYAYDACILIQPATFFRSAIYRRTKGFNVQNRTNWDGELFVDMYQAGGVFGRVDDILGAYRLHGESITASAKYDSMIRQYQETMFRRIMGREKRIRDIPIKVLLRFYKHASNPRALVERLLKGPMYGRHSSISY